MVDHAVLPPVPKLAVKLKLERLGEWLKLTYRGDQKDPDTEALVDLVRDNGLKEVSKATHL